MFKMVTRILGVIALTGWMGAANATLIFDFSWDGGGDVITGEIFGLSDNGNNLSASGIILTSVGSNAVIIDINLDPDIWFESVNSFSVTNGILVSWHFFVGGQNIADNLEFAIHENFVSLDFEGSYYSGSISKSSFVNRVTVPEPSSVILMLLGLAGLSFARYRKQY
jgi:hypothetical protein